MLAGVKFNLFERSKCPLLLLSFHYFYAFLLELETWSESLLAVFLVSPVIQEYVDKILLFFTWQGRPRYRRSVWWWRRRLTGWWWRGWPACRWRTGSAAIRGHRQHTYREFLARYLVRTTNTKLGATKFVTFAKSWYECQKLGFRRR